MVTRPITVNLPEHLYDRLRQQAAQAHRTVEEELVTALASVTSSIEALPNDLQAAIDSLAFLDDHLLWRAAQQRLSRRDFDQMESLQFKRQREGLTEAEMSNLAELVRRSEQIMLVRAEAAVLLKERGHDITSLGPRPQR